MARKTDDQLRLPIFALTAVASIALLTSCASKRADASVPTAPVAVATTGVATGPLSVPQTQVVLPPPQPVPEGAIPPRQTSVVTMGPVQPESIPTAPVSSNPTTPRQPQAAPPVTVPLLGRLLSAEQTREYNRVISQNVLAAQSSLDLLARRRLTPSQRPSVERVKAFLAQVSEARGSDLELARSLSERARLLAEDMVRNLPR